MDKPLAEVFAPVKFGDCAWAVFDPVNDLFAITQSAVTNPPDQSRDGLFIAMLIIEHEKTGHWRALDEQMPLTLGPLGGGSQLAIEAVPQITMRAPTASCGNTASLIAPAVLSK